MSTLTIDVRSDALRTLPSALAERLTGPKSPKSPDELASAIEQHSARTHALRTAHLDAVKDRAARDSQRVSEANARKLRLAAAAREKVVRKLDTAFSKVSAKKDEVEAKRQAAKEKRLSKEELVKENRTAKHEATLRRQAFLLEAEQTASAKHAKCVADIKTKNACAVSHAIAVVQAQREKVANEAEEGAAKIASKLYAAEARRQNALPASTIVASPPLHRVRNDNKVLSEKRRIALEASLAKATEKREAHLASVMGKAHAENVKAAAVVEKMHAAATGVDAATAEAKAALYERLMRAEVARLSALKAKYSKAKGDGVSVIVVRMDDVLKCRAPPLALIKRLALRGTSLVATASARQAAAASRRMGLKHARQLALATAAARRANASARRTKAAAAKAADIKARETRSVVTLALGQGKQAAAASLMRKRLTAAADKRAQFKAALEVVAKMRAARNAAAAERRTKHAPVVAARLAAFVARRAAIADKLVANGEAKALRCTAAATKRAALLAQRVETARKRMKPMHPNSEA